MKDLLMEEAKEFHPGTQVVMRTDLPDGNKYLVGKCTPDVHLDTAGLEPVDGHGLGYIQRPVMVGRSALIHDSQDSGVPLLEDPALQAFVTVDWRRYSGLSLPFIFRTGEGLVHSWRSNLRRIVSGETHVSRAGVSYPVPAVVANPVATAGVGVRQFTLTVYPDFQVEPMQLRSGLTYVPYQDVRSLVGDVESLARLWEAMQQHIEAHGADEVQAYLELYEVVVKQV